MTSATLLLPSVKKISWYKHGHYRNNYLFCEYVGRGLTLQHFQKAGINASFNHFLKIGWDHYLDTRDKEALVKAVEKGFKNDSLFLEHYLQHYKEDCDAAIEVARQIHDVEVQKLSNEELINHFRQFIQSHVQLGHWLWNLEFVNFFLDQHIRTILKEKVTDIDLCLLDISYSDQELDFIREQRELWQLAAMAHKRNIKNVERVFQKELQNHWKKYAWLNMYIYNGDPFEYDYFVARLKEMIAKDPGKKLQKEEKEKQTRKQKCERTLTLFKENSALLSLIKNVQELIYFKTYRIDVYTRTTHMVFPLLEEIAQRIGTTRKILVDLSEQEIIRGLHSGKADLLLYERRKIEDVILKLRNNLFFFSGEEAKKVRAAFPEEDLSHWNEVKGTMGYPGKVQGKAKIVNTELELGKVEKGDILISPMTNPNYGPVFDKVAAIVTDEGGILCHSAIVSREMKIPCVMGTKFSTRVFKDGELIEVDAQKGIVKKVK